MSGPHGRQTLVIVAATAKKLTVAKRDGCANLTVLGEASRSWGGPVEGNLNHVQQHFISVISPEFPVFVVF